MEYIFSQALHIFIMSLILFFGIMCLIASGGSFDHWNSRLKRRGKQADAGTLNKQPIIEIVHKYIVKYL